MPKKTLKQFTIDDLQRVLGYSAAMLTDWLKNGVVAEWGDYGRRMDWSDECVSLAVRVLEKAMNLLDAEEFVKAAELLNDFGFSPNEHTRDVLFDIEDFDDPYEVVNRFSVKAARLMEKLRAANAVRSKVQENSTIEKRKNFAKKYPSLIKESVK